jgi:site-specific DNA-methyltransferase (adenine-specific)
MSEVKLILGDCLDKLKDLESNSVDSIVTDPPYGLSFMGQKWDYDVPSVSIWKECLRVLKPGGHILSFSSSRTYHRMVVNVEDAGFEIRDQIMWVYGSGFPKSHNLKNESKGWGTALKPAHEPIVMARKPLEKKTVANNVLEYGTGAINIDGCRVGDEGRWPANFIHDGSEEVLEHFPHTKSGKMGPEHNRHTDSSPNGIYGKFDVNHPLGQTYGDAGSAARFFYVAKANKKDREEDNNHPTIKPTELMKYLIRLVTPKNGTILDPFMGSGSTGKAAVLEGFSFTGIELSEDYLKIAEKRINHAITINE